MLRTLRPIGNYFKIILKRLLIHPGGTDCVLMVSNNMVSDPWLR